MLPFEPISRVTVVKCLGPRLVIFFKTFALFYVLYPKHESTIGYCLFKCAPILSLIGFVYMYGVKSSLSKQDYAMKILLGLVFSCLGDACLVWPKYFLPGMGFFAITHILYIHAFGIRPLKLFILFALLPSLIFICIYVREGFNLLTGLVCPAYGLLLVLMMWRAVAQLYKHEYSIPWTSISCALGGLLFGLSDSLLAVSIFAQEKSLLSTLILPTYYAGQLLIAVSVVDSQLTSLKANQTDVKRE
ncbi:unnamed protein product [Trichobilharzia szidati]|nr:unnamed protein product [Trichobilharzia szidati]